jgi:hypothetical protein
MSADKNLDQGEHKKQTINLLQPELLPEQVLLSLPRVTIIWAVAFAVMIGWAILAHYQQQVFTAQQKTLEKEKAKQTQTLDRLSLQLSARKVNSELTEKLVTLKLLMANKHALHAKLTDSNQTYVAGFAVAMSELSQMHHQDIRLQSIHINNDNMTFSGLALNPDAVPAWLAGFENSLLLSGKVFGHFKLSENKQNMIEFVVSSKMQGSVQ